MNAGGKNAVCLERASCGTVLEVRRGHVKRGVSWSFLPKLVYRQYNIKYCLPATEEAPHGEANGGSTNVYTVYCLMPADFEIRKNS